MKIAEKFVFLLFVFLFFSSCATIFNKTEKKILVSSDISDAKMKFNDSIYNLPSEIKVERKKEILNLELITDSITKNFSIPFSLDQKFKTGNLAFIYFAPVGYVIDLTNNKRFNYPNNIYLNLEPTKVDSKNLIKIEKIAKKQALRLKRMEREKGDVIINVIAPSFHFYDLTGLENERYQKGGALGIGVGIDYYYKNNKFLNFETSIKTNLYDILISSLTIDDRLEIYNFSLTDNYRINRFELGYGLNATITDLEYTTIKPSNQSYVGNNPTNPIPVKNKIFYNEKQVQFGLSTRAAYQVSGIFNIGIFFRPTFVQIHNSNSKAIFESVYGMDFRFKLKIKK